MTAVLPSSRDVPLKLMVCAVEPSGDAIGADLMAALREELNNNVVFIGCGGPLMAQQGLKSLFPITPFSVVGPLDALKALPEAIKCARILAEVATVEEPAAAIMIDGWAFSKLAAGAIKKRSPLTSLIKYVAPQVWASRPKRAETLARLFDGVLVLFSFEIAWFEKFGIKTRFVGNSSFQKAASAQIDPESFRQKEGLGSSPLLAVLPGSRKGEVQRLAPPFCETIDLLCKRIPDLKIAIPVAPAVEENIRQVTENWQCQPILVDGKDRYALFAAADAAMTASGTASTELAIFNTPMIVAYKVGAISAFWFRKVITTPYVTLLNIVAGREIVPEFLQDACQPQEMADRLLPLLSSSQPRRAQLDAFPGLLSSLGVGGTPAAKTGAKAILGWINEKNPT